MERVATSRHRNLNILDTWNQLSITGTGMPLKPGLSITGIGIPLKPGSNFSSQE